MWMQIFPDPRKLFATSKNQVPNDENWSTQNKIFELSVKNSSSENDISIVWNIWKQPTL
jgi:hypothetical protein